MTTTDEIETILTRAFAAAPSADAVQVLDQRVARAMAASATVPRGRAPSRRCRSRRSSPRSWSSLEPWSGR